MAEFTFEFKTKTVPMVFVVINGHEVIAHDLCELLETFCNDDEINDYDLNNVGLAKILVEIGVLKVKNGSRMAVLYCMTDKFESFYNNFMNEYLKD